MKPTRGKIKYLLFSIVFAAILALALPSGRILAQETTKENPQQFVSIDFNNVDINVFIKFMSELTGTNFVVDQRVKGRVTSISPSMISLHTPVAHLPSGLIQPV